MQDPALQKLLAWLREKHAAIKKLELQAKACLYEKKDEAEYRRLMRERAGSIAALDTESESFVTALPDQEMRDGVAGDLSRFATGGRNALRIDSIFYMSALLYPDDYAEGEPDNLERLIILLEGR